MGNRALRTIAAINWSIDVDKKGFGVCVCVCVWYKTPYQSQRRIDREKSVHTQPTHGAVFRFTTRYQMRVWEGDFTYSPQLTQFKKLKWIRMKSIFRNNATHSRSMWPINIYIWWKRLTDHSMCFIYTPSRLPIAESFQVYETVFLGCVCVWRHHRMILSHGAQSKKKKYKITQTIWPRRRSS